MGRSPFIGTRSPANVLGDKGLSQSPLLDILLEGVDALALQLPVPSVALDEDGFDARVVLRDEPVVETDTLATTLSSDLAFASPKGIQHPPPTPALQASEEPAEPSPHLMPMWCYVEADEDGSYLVTPLPGGGDIGGRTLFGDFDVAAENYEGPSEELIATVVGPLPCDSHVPEWKGPRHIVPTTLVLSNLPDGLTQSVFLEVLDREGFCGLYDFVFLPIDACTGRSCGYAVVNVMKHAFGLVLAARLHGRTFWGADADDAEPCAVAWSNPLQGLADNVYVYRNHPLNDETIDEELRPQIFSRGWRVSFPGATLPSLL